MLILIGLLSNQYFSYLNINFIISKGNVDSQKKFTFNSSFQVLSRITFYILMIEQFWIQGTFLDYPNLTSSSGVIVTMFDGQQKISNLTIYGQSFLIFIVQIIIYIIGTNNEGKQTGPPELFQMILTNIIGIVYLINSNDQVITITAWELINLTLYLLVTMRGGRGNDKTLIINNADIAQSAGLKYFLQSAQTTSYQLMGISQIYGKLGSTNYDTQFSIFNIIDSYNLVLVKDYNLYSVSQNNKDQTQHIGLILISITFMFKLGAAPFHSWAPDLYDAIPTPITMYLSIIPKIGIQIFLQVISPLFYHIIIPIFLGQIAIISIIVGSIGLGSQWRIKRFITFSAISHLGFIILAYISFSNFSYIYYIVIYAITSVLFFSNILAINTATCSEKFNSINKYISQNSSKNQYLSFSDMGGDIQSLLTGLFKYNYFIAISISIAFLSQAGIPPLGGFFAKLMVLRAQLYDAQIYIAIIAILLSTISTTYYLSLIKISDQDLPYFINPNHKNIESINIMKISIKSINSNIIAIFSTFLLFFFMKPESVFNVIISFFLFNYIKTFKINQSI